MFRPLQNNPMSSPEKTSLLSNRPWRKRVTKLWLRKRELLQFPAPSWQVTWMCSHFNRDGHAGKMAKRWKVKTKATYLSSCSSNSRSCLLVFSPVQINLMSSPKKKSRISNRLWRKWVMKPFPRGINCMRRRKKPPLPTRRQKSRNILPRRAKSSALLIRSWRNKTSAPPANKKFPPAADISQTHRISAHRIKRTYKKEPPPGLFSISPLS